MKNLKKYLTATALISALSFSQGCAHNALEKHIDDEVAQESAISTHTELRTEANQLIQTAPGLSTKQKALLSSLREVTLSQSDALWEQSLKLRSVLIKDLITTQYNEDEVELIKTRIKDLENRRLSLLFNSVEQANLIMGHDTIANRQIANSFLRENRDRPEGHN